MSTTDKNNSEELTYCEVPEFIELVRNYEVLYNVQLQRYKDTKSKIQNERQAAWEEIAETVNSTPDECKRRWRKLRNCYLGAMTRHKINQSLGRESAVWKYESEMSFLKPYIEQKERDIKQHEKTPRKRRKRNYDDNDLSNFISLVQNHEVLYNNTHPQYKNIGWRKLAWSEIAKEMNCSVNECKTRWSWLRKNFYETMKRQFGKQKLGLETVPWRYEKEMAFILSYMDVKRIDDQNNTNSTFEDDVIKNSSLSSIDIEESGSFEDDNVDEPYISSSSNNNEISNVGEDFDDAIFINLIQQHEMLYNNECSEYKDIDARHAAWKIVAELMNRTVHDCKARWLRLKNCYINTLKENTGRQEFSKEWKYEPEMTFLLPYLDIHIESNKDCETPLASQLPKSETSEQSDNDDDCENINDEVTSLYKIKPEEVMIEVGGASDMVVNDETDLFFLNISKNVKMLPQQDQDNIKTELSKLVSEVQRKISGFYLNTHEKNVEDV